VVKPFYLPKNQHTVLPSSLLSSTISDHRVEIDEAVPSAAEVSYSHSLDSQPRFAEDVEMREVAAEVPSRRSNAAPKSMRELAEDDMRRQASEIATSNEPDSRSSSTPAERKKRGGMKALMKSGTDTPSARTSSVKRKNGKKRIREDSASGSDDDHRFGATSTHMMGTPNTTSGRVLRPRPQKNAAKLREEVESERAFRRAIAE
jgi:xeroderma pigmentosum group C-complementing protein